MEGKEIQNTIKPITRINADAGSAETDTDDNIDADKNSTSVDKDIQNMDNNDDENRSEEDEKMPNQKDEINDKSLDSSIQSKSITKDTEDMEEDEDDNMEESINQDENDEDDEDDQETLSEGKSFVTNSDIPNTHNGMPISSGDGNQSAGGVSSHRSNRRKNKRKNFKPRNILYGETDEEEQDKNEGGDSNANDVPRTDDQSPLNLSGHSTRSLSTEASKTSSTLNLRTLLPRKILEQQMVQMQHLSGEREHPSSPNTISSPMDLSNHQHEEDDDEITREETDSMTGTLTVDEGDEMADDCANKNAAAAAARGLSVVRPEVLFGENNSNSVTSGSPTSSPGLPLPQSSQAPPSFGAFPPGLMPLFGLPGMPAARSPSISSSAAVQPSSDAMKEAFQEVLKLYGVPSELAEAIAKNAQNTQGKQMRFNLYLSVNVLWLFVNNQKVYLISML